MEQIKFIFKRLTHLLIAVLAIVGIFFAITSRSTGSTSEQRDEYAMRTALFRDVWGKQVELEFVETVMDISKGYPTGIIAKVRNNSAYPIDNTNVWCDYEVATAYFETKVRNGVDVLEPSSPPRKYTAKSAEEFFRIEPGQTVVLNYKANFVGTVGINNVSEIIKRVKMGRCYGLGSVNEHDAFRIAFQQPLP